MKTETLNGLSAAWGTAVRPTFTSQPRTEREGCPSACSGPGTSEPGPEPRPPRKNRGYRRLGALFVLALTCHPSPAQTLYEPYTFTTLAGIAGHGSVDGTGSAARFRYPCGVAVDSAGNVYVADTGNHTIRKVTPAGVVTTLAGLAGSSGSADGTGSAARFNGPAGVAVDSAGNVYVADHWQPHDPQGDARRGGDDAGRTGGQIAAARTARAAPRGSTLLPAWRWTAPATSMWRTTYNHTIRKVTPARAW